MNVCPAVSPLLVTSKQVAVIVQYEQVGYEILFVPTYSFNVPHHPGDARIKTCGYFFPIVSFGFSLFVYFLIEIAHCTLPLGLHFKIHLLAVCLLRSFMKSC